MDIVYAGYLHPVEVGQEPGHGLCRRSSSFKVGREHGHGLCTIFFIFFLFRGGGARRRQ